MALLCVGAVVVALVREPDQPRSQCAPPQECPGPPLGQPPSQFRRWASHARGVSLVYPRRVFATESTSDTSLRLRVRASRPSGVEANLWLTVQRAGRTLPNELLEERKDVLLVPEAALSQLAVQGISFIVDGPASYDSSRSIFG